MYILIIGIILLVVFFILIFWLYGEEETKINIMEQINKNNLQFTPKKQ
jgi:hypothetical protein